MDKEKPRYSDEGQSDEVDVAESIEDERSELDIKLEQIESIESRSLKTTRSSDPTSNSATGAGLADSNKAGVTESQESAEDPAILAARAAMRSANREDTKKSASRKKLRTAVVLLVILLLGALGAVAGLYYLQSTTKDQLATAQASLSAMQSELAALKKAPVVESLPENVEKNDAQQSNGYRTISEWGVRYQLTEENSDVEYGLITVAPQESIGLYSITLARAAGMIVDTNVLRCGVGSAGVLMRLSETQLKEQSPQQKLTEGEYKKIGEFTYLYRAPQGLCADMPQQEKAATDAARSIIATLELVPEN